jgi:hypothetical protein
MRRLAASNPRFFHLEFCSKTRRKDRKIVEKARNSLATRILSELFLSSLSSSELFEQAKENAESSQHDDIKATTEREEESVCRAKQS